MPCGVAIKKAVPATRSISAAAQRMRRHRQRRRDGVRSLQIELRETEVDALIESGFLEERSRDDPNAVIRALYKFFDDILIE
jgi:SOS response regulatory protein OraA/RecX